MLIMNATHRYPNSSVLVISHSLTFQEVIQLGQPIDLRQRSSQLCYTIRAFSSQRKEGSLVKNINNTEHCPAPLIYPANQNQELCSLNLVILLYIDISCLGGIERQGVSATAHSAENTAHLALMLRQCPPLHQTIRSGNVL